MRRQVLGVLAGSLALLTTNLLAAERIALIIGNGKYEHIGALDNPPKDVELVSAALRDVGFDVTTLLDADIAAMDQSLANFYKKMDQAGSETVGLFYFAGHGMTFDGENWLIPVDAQVTDPSHIRRRTVSAQDILKEMEDRKNKTNIMILDACRDAPFKQLRSGTRAVSRGMAEMRAPRGSFIAFSTAAGQVAYDGQGDYSPFAEAFAAEIRTPNVPINGMMINVNARVRKSTENLGAVEQVPWVNHSLSDNFWFNPAGDSGNQRLSGGSVQPQPAPLRVDPGPRKKTPAELEEEMWGDIKDSGDPAEYSIFLEQFPDGRYAGLAKARQARFSKKAEPKTQEVIAQPTPNTDVDPNIAICRQYAAGDSADFAECMAEMNQSEPDDDFFDFGGGGMDARNVIPNNIPAPEPGGMFWVDDEYNQWQVTLNGAYFTATANLPGTGMLMLQGQFAGNQVSFGIFDAFGNQIGYGSGVFADQTHFNTTSYYSNGVLIGNTQFHVNHMPQ